MLANGAWFPIFPKDAKRKCKTNWRFTQLSRNRRTLHFQDYLEKQKVKPEFQDLSQTVEVASIQGLVLIKEKVNNDFPHGFRLILDNDLSVEFYFDDKELFIDWYDGFSVLIQQFLHPETTTFAQEVTNLELNTRVALLKAENIVISNEIPIVPPIPTDKAYFFTLNSR